MELNEAIYLYLLMSGFFVALIVITGTCMFIYKRYTLSKWQKNWPKQEDFIGRLEAGEQLDSENMFNDDLRKLVDMDNLDVYSAKVRGEGTI